MSDFMQFRTSLNGYNREDVVAFVDQMTQEHEEALRQLKDKNTELLGRLEEAEAENTQLRSRLDEAELALASAGDPKESEHAISEANNLMAALRVKNEMLEKRIREMEAASRNGEDQAQTPLEAVSDLTAPKETQPVPAVQAKDYTEMELAAYRRAELVERRARERANDIYRGIQTVFSQANSRLGTGRDDLEHLSQTLTADFNQLLTLLTNLNKSYQGAEDSFAELEEKNRKYLEGEE